MTILAGDVVAGGVLLLLVLAVIFAGGRHE
jgi:hypothetical protein